jgi:hypothetical protein
LRAGGVDGVNGAGQDAGIHRQARFVGVECIVGHGDDGNPGMLARQPVGHPGRAQIAHGVFKT